MNVRFLGRGSIPVVPCALDGEVSVGEAGGAGEVGPPPSAQGTRDLGLEQHPHLPPPTTTTKGDNHTPSAQQHVEPLLLPIVLRVRGNHLVGQSINVKMSLDGLFY